jgi:hypothetical protein
MAKSIEEKKAEQTERSILLIMSTCTHFTGIQHMTQILTVERVCSAIDAIKRRTSEPTS